MLKIQITVSQDGELNYQNLIMTLFTKQEGKINVNADASSRNPIELYEIENEKYLSKEEVDASDRVFAMQTRTQAGKLNIPNYRDLRRKAPNNNQKQKEKVIENKKNEESDIRLDHAVIEEDRELNLPEFNSNEMDNEDPLSSNQNFDENINKDPEIEILRQEDHMNKEILEATNTEVEKQLPQRLSGKIFAECRDQLFMRKDNLLYFVNTNGEACDDGSKQLSSRNELPKLKNLKIGEIKKMFQNNKLHLIVPIRGTDKESLTVLNENIAKGFKSLKSIIEAEQLKSISIAKGEHIEHVNWTDAMIKLRNILKGVNVKIIICLGLVRCPEVEEREKLIEEAHCSAVGGHKGVTKTFKRIRQRYNWPNLKIDIQQFIQQCLSCQLKKLVRVKTKNPMVITDTPTTPFHKISMDIVGPLPRTKNGYENVLTIQCALTKYSMAIALPDATAQSVATALIKQFICIFGAPAAILTDQGTNFLSNLMKRIAKRFRIKQFKTTAFHPQSNGSIERSHHVLAEYLKSYISKDEQWDMWLELAMFSYNTSCHEGTNHTPYELVFGRLARLPSSDPIEPEDDLPTYQNYLVDLITRLHDIQKKGEMENKILL